jgi:hypothetical protein
MKSKAQPALYRDLCRDLSSNSGPPKLGLFPDATNAADGKACPGGADPPAPTAA